MTEQSKIFPGEPAGAEVENAVLRASIAELRDRLAEFEQRVDGDPLTGLPNRRRLIHELGRIVASTDRYGTPSALIELALANIDEINAFQGRPAGDAALRHVAGQLSGLIRSADIAARSSGSRFALLLDHVDHNSAIDAADRITRRASGAPFEYGGRSIQLRLDAGVAAILPGDEEGDILLRAASNLARARAEADEA